MNSDMSIRTMLSSLSNMKFANVLHSSVLPTPVGPKNKNDPIGRFGSDKPARLRLMAFATASTASFCPITRWCNSSSIRNNLSRSPSNILATGIPVCLESTSAISASVTLFFNKLISCISAWAARSSCFSSSGIFPYCNSDIRLRSPARRATSISIRACSSSDLICWVPESAAFSAFHTSSSSAYSRSLTSSSSQISFRRFWLAPSLSLPSACCSIFNWIIRRSKRSSNSGFESICIRMLDAASSIKSIALSGNCRSET